jgi:putative GTP pyrophosphokinase
MFEEKLSTDRVGYQSRHFLCTLPKSKTNLIEYERFYRQTLEIVDNEFERISKEIDKYSEEISDRTKRGKLDISINTTSLKQYLSEKIVSPFISPGFGAGQRRIVEELNIVGINTLEQLDKIISQDFIDEYVATLQKLNVGDNYTSFLRHLMMIKFTDKYFKKAWRRSFNLDDGDLRILSSFGVVPYKR